ncbi:uncharacterized protein LOC127283899 [Leptopilina boulardi]|uniref:uncharacterized protein LOC127283899 n=1 Tax=Leptopilina boulardi TaxID=63433 RepID=UPI0021F51B03|nr:uncharacterized protein LOC127283899 [Leptopilina boulardi]
MDQNAANPPSIDTPQDLTESADKKSRTRERSTSDKPTTMQAPTAASGLYALCLRTLSTRFSTPVSIAETQMHVVVTSTWIPYFRSIWISLTSVLYPDGHFHATGIINQADFVAICRNLLAARLDDVHCRFYDGIQTTRRLVPYFSELPLSLSRILSGVEVVITHPGAITNVPQYCGDPAADPLPSLPAGAVLKFAKLIQSCKRRNFIRTGRITENATGTSWWMLSAVNATTHEIADGNADSIIIRASFSEWTSVDAHYSSVLQNGSSGIVDVDNKAVWHSSYISDVISIRNFFNLGV